MEKTLKSAVSNNAHKQLIELPRGERSPKANARIDQEEKYFERKFLRGIITDTDFCRYAVENYPIKYLDADSAKQLATWVYEDFKKFQTAPKKGIEEVFWKNTKNLSEDATEYIEEILESLSEEEQNTALDVPRLKDTAARMKHKKIHAETLQKAQAAYEDGDLEEASLYLNVANPFERDSTTYEEIKALLCPSRNFIEKAISTPKRLLSPWLTEGSMSFLYGERGKGKSWLCLLIALALTRENQEDMDIGEWQAKEKAKVLYVDGEMTTFEMQDRIRELSKNLPPEDNKNGLVLFMASEYFAEYKKQLNLTDKNRRDAISEILEKDRQYKLVILDNIASLFPGLSENDKEAWDPINQWLISLRHMNVATIVVHHAGKNGQQRGTSGREDNMDNVIKVMQPKGYNSIEDRAYFEVSFEKHRSLKTTDSKSPFCIRIEEHPDGGLTWQTEEKRKEDADKKERITVDLIKGMQNKDIAEKYGCVKGYVTQVKKKAMNAGYLDPDGKPTKKGYDLEREMEETMDNSVATDN